MRTSPEDFLTDTLGEERKYGNSKCFCQTNDGENEQEERSFPGAPREETASHQGEGEGRCR